MRLAFGIKAAIVCAAACVTFPSVAFAQDGLRRERDGPTFRIPDQVDFNDGVERPARGEAAKRIRIRPADDFDVIAFGGETVEARLRDMGVRDGAAFRERGRLYLFAADGETSVGYNLTRSGDGAWNREGLSLDDGAFIGDAQAGVAWRAGSTQTSFGYVHREVERESRFGRDRQEGFVALQFSYTPGR